jgi:hypothetical protein
MINFDDGIEKLNKFLGSEKKTTILYNNELYMLKYPDPIREQKRKGIISYKNNQYSEYIGSNIFASCGIAAQKTVLGYFTDKTTGKRKTVVGCKDFTQDSGTLYEIDKLSNPIAPDEGQLATTIENVNRIIAETELITDKKSIKDGFWDMFVVDTLIGNKDRHFGNWGVVEKDGEVSFAPVYDCGSSLSALLEDGEMEELLEDPGAFKREEYNIPSVYNMDGKRIFYHEIFKNPPDDLRAAIKRFVPKIDMTKIRGIVESTPEMSELRKRYLITAITLRYDQILAPALKRELNAAQEAPDNEKPSTLDQVRAARQKAKQEPQPRSPKKNKRSEPDL